jgi:hypothetical protein
MKQHELTGLLPGVPLIESPFFEQILPSCDFDAETAKAARDLNHDGFAVLRFPDDEINERADRIRRDLSSSFNFDHWRAEIWPKNGDMRLMDTWRTNDDVRAIASNAKMQKILSDVYGRRAWPFQTLVFPVGSQQHAHSDSVHFSSIPERFMCGVWVALEDVGSDAGPLMYYPGSHKWPILYNEKLGIRVTGTSEHRSQHLYDKVWEELLEITGAKPTYFCPKKGDVLIWSANLLHGGAKQTNSKVTRWSQVTHYYFDDCCYITPMHSDVMIGKLFLRDMTDISTGRKMPNIYVDTPVSEIGKDTAGLPSDFDAGKYLQLNVDVALAGLAADVHYLSHGAREGRPYK